MATSSGPLDGLSFDAADGELVVLLGPSGCGKTTLLSCLAGLLTPTSGSIKLDDRETSRLSGRDLTAHRRDTVGVVFQAFNLIPSLSAHGNVVAPMRLAGMSRRHAERRGRRSCSSGWGSASEATIGPASSRAVSSSAWPSPARWCTTRPLVLADEPTAHLDHIQVEGVLQLLRELASPGRVVIVSTHDDRVTHLADRVVELQPNLASADRPPEELRFEPGELVFEQGSRGDLVYVVEAGEVEIFRTRGDGTEEPLATVIAGGYFGELGPTLNLPRSASARAATATHAHQLHPPPLPTTAPRGASPPTR